jgi:hypothetical protein
MSGVNSSEEFVGWLCGGTFLRMWTHPNPQRPNRKELCDVLVVFGQEVLIVSVKDCAIKTTGNDELDVERWLRKAVHKSVKQLYVARQRLIRMPAVLDSSGREQVEVPDPAGARIHLVAVALGGDERVALSSRDFGKGYVHVWDVDTARRLISELDTAGDLIDLMTAVEALTSRCALMIEGGEEDLLAWYLKEQRSFPADVNFMVLQSGVWEDYDSRPEVKRKREANEISYTWDHLIDLVAEHWTSAPGVSREDYLKTEYVLRLMAAERRLQRRVLGEAFVGLLRAVVRGEAISRLVFGGNQVYVFHWMPFRTVEDIRRNELLARCLVARRRYPDAAKIIGVGTDYHHKSGRMTSVALQCIEQPVEDPQIADLLEQLGERDPYSQAPAVHVHAEEYPSED